MNNTQEAANKYKPVMFCRQCEQTWGGHGCTIQGVCGKTPNTANLQDELIHELKVIGTYGKLARELGAKDSALDKFVIELLFTTITNVNFDEARLSELKNEAILWTLKAKTLFFNAYKKKNNKDFTGNLPETYKASDFGAFSKPATDSDIRSLRELILYGIKGMAAYADHALVLGKNDETVDSFFYKALDAIYDDTKTVEELIALLVELGKVNLRCMEILDEANTGAYGHPVPTEVLFGVKKGPAIIVSGHDLKDLYELLKQTDGKGINIYTHGEMLPSHGYPKLKKHPQLVGHFGTAWQNQQKEFNDIPATILMTTNCIQKPMQSYNDRIFTTNLVAFPGVKHIPTDKIGNKDFSELIKKTIELGGFKEEKINSKVMVGFAHNTLLGVADKVIEAIKTGVIKHIFLIGGCDGAKPGRNYFTEFAQKVPKDCLILTLACGKFRFNQLDFGTLAGFPRLLDCGQCNDAYSAIKVVLALSQALGKNPNELPISIVLSWYEQKAVVVLETLLALGIKNIRLGPTLPAFVSKGVLEFLVKNFDIKPTKTADEDLKEILG